MKKFVLMFLFVAFMALASGQEIVYVGTIGTQELQLFITPMDAEGSVTATYYPDLNSEMIELKGTLGGDGILLEQIQSSSGNNAISFKGKLDDSSDRYKPSFKGVWSDGVLSKEFEITKLVEFAKIAFAQDEYISAQEIYPHFLDADYSLLNKFFQDQAMKEQYDFFIEGQELSSSEDFFNFWEQDCETGLSYFSSSFASAFKACYNYTGGAHPNQHFESFNLGFGNDEILEFSLDQLFVDGSDYESVLSDYLISSLKGQNASAVSGGDISSFTIDDLTVVNISNQGLRFSFQPYKVASYAEGPFFVDIPVTVFKEFIDPEGPISFFSN